MKMLGPPLFLICLPCYVPYSREQKSSGCNTVPTPQVCLKIYYVFVMPPSVLEHELVQGDSFSEKL
jgi:hypothetical protein